MCRPSRWALGIGGSGAGRRNSQRMRRRITVHPARLIREAEGDAASAGIARAGGTVRDQAQDAQLVGVDRMAAGGGLDAHVGGGRGVVGLVGADGAARPGDPGGCCIALGLRGYVECADIGWRATTQGEWFLDRVGRYAIPAHEIAQLIREADDGARHLATATEIPVGAWDALTEARWLLALAQKQVAEAMRVVQPATARKES